jgi:hypothetical protein
VTIYYSRNIWGTKFYQNNYRINFNQLPGLVSQHEKAAGFMKQARANKTGSVVLSGVGGFVLAWQLGTWIVGGDPNWVVAGVGEGLILVSLPFNSRANRLAIQAIDIYNRNLLAESQKSIINLGLLPGGFGVKMQF